MTPSTLKTSLYAILKTYTNELNMAPSALVATVAALISDLEGEGVPLDSLEEAAAYLQKSERSEQ